MLLHSSSQRLKQRINPVDLCLKLNAKYVTRSAWFLPLKVNASSIMSRAPRTRRFSAIAFHLARLAHLAAITPFSLNSPIATEGTYDIFWCFSLLRFLLGPALVILDSSPLDPSSLLRVEFASSSAIEGPLIDVDGMSISLSLSPQSGETNYWGME
jgi:hypothetical protein